MPSVTVTRITRTPDGGVRISFGKHEREYTSIQHLRTSVRDNLSRDDLIDLALALIVARQPNLGNVAALEGRTVTVDFTQANWGTVV